MNRLHRGLRVLALGAVLAGTVTTAAVSTSYAQAAAAPDVTVRAQMAAITLDQESLPDGYAFVGEAFLTADQVASGDLKASSLTDAGFVGQYVSVYQNTSDKSRIRSYVSAWKDQASAEKGYALLEDEKTTDPKASLKDGDTSVGDAPHEISTGTYPEGTNTIGTADVTFRSGSFLVGLAVEKTDGSAPSADTAQQLAKTEADRAATVIGGKNPDFADLALPAQALPLDGLGTEVQAGFISPAEAESIYNLTGSALDKLKASWTDTIGLGKTDAQVPYVTVSLTTFGSDTDAKAIVTGAKDLSPDLTNAKAVDGAKVDGADATTAFTFSSLATGATNADSYRVIYSKGATVVVIDVQGAKKVEDAQSAAQALATSQLACLGKTTCAAPAIPAALSS
jgi:hypothetical protein